MTTPAKREALLASGTLNPHPAAVRSVLFHMDFFDPYDFAQVKYEMLVIECLATHIFINPLHGIVARDECASPALSATSEVLRCWGDFLWHMSHKPVCGQVPGCRRLGNSIRFPRTFASSVAVEFSAIRVESPH